MITTKTTMDMMIDDDNDDDNDDDDDDSYVLYTCSLAHLLQHNTN